MSGIGILAIGAHLPPEIRRNDWWSPATVARWVEARARGVEALRAIEPSTPAMATVLQAMIEGSGDPFRGVTERRVMAAGTVATDMEAAAAELALSRAGVDRAAIDALLVHSAVPEYLLANNACNLHFRLGLRPSCLAIEAQASAYSFLAQLALARALIASGQSNCVLAVQSSAASRLIDPDDPVSGTFGDAATAVVIGRVGSNRGIRSAAHYANGKVPNSLIAGVRGGRWYDGRSVLHLADPVGERAVILDTVDRGREVISEALDAAAQPPSAVDFFAVHQGTSWLRRLTQEAVGIEHARTVDVYARTGYVFGASLPLVLDAALTHGSLSDDDLVVVFGGGTGMTCGATVLRWGTS
jgi:3-oxoacyl-[acyl-carrier-protein] synthase III